MYWQVAEVLTLNQLRGTHVDWKDWEMDPYTFCYRHKAETVDGLDVPLTISAKVRGMLRSRPVDSV